MVFFASALLVNAQLKVPRAPTLENFSGEIAIEARPDGHIYIVATAERPGTGEPIKKEIIGMRGNLSFEAASPNVGQLLITVDGSVTLPEAALDEMPPEVRAGLAAATPQMINLMIAMYFPIEGKTLRELMGMARQAAEIPSEIADVRIEDFTCTKFSWREPTLSAGFSATLSGTIFENQELRDELPVTIEVVFDVSKTAMNFGIEFSSRTADGGFGMILTPEKISLKFEGSFELLRVENEVQWEFLPEAQMICTPEEVEELKELLEKNNIELTLKLPADAIVADLPSGYAQIGPTYTWSSDVVPDALASQLTGEVLPNITYAYVYVPSPSLIGAPPELVEDPKLTIRGTAEAGSTIKVYINQEVRATTTAGADGAFSTDITLDKGFNSIRVSTTDAAGNESSRILYGATTYVVPAPERPWLLWALTAVGIVIVIVAIAIVLKRRRSSFTSGYNR